MPPPAWFFLAVIAMTALRVVAPGPAIAADAVALLGLLPIGAGVALNVAAVHAFRRGATTTEPEGVPAALVTDGVYRHVRNPMYLGGVLILAGWALLLGTATPVLLPPLYAALASRRFVPPEERRLDERFGDAWRDYAARTPRGL